MKKIRNLLYVVIFLVCALALVPKVDALTPEFQSITIKQGDTVLTKEGNNYIAPGYDDLFITYSIPGNNYGYYYIEVYEDEISEDNYVTGGSYYPDYVSHIWLSIPYMESPNKTYIFRLCDEWECTNVYDTKTVNVIFNKVGTFADDKVYITKAMQGGTQIYYDDTNSGYIFNNHQDIVFSVKAENLDSTAKYELECFNKSMVYTGAELMTGVNHTCIIGDYSYSSFSLFYRISRDGWGVGELSEEPGYMYYPQFYLEDDSNIKSFNSNLKYTNYNKELSRVDDDDYGERYHYLALSKYFNATDTMTYYVKGTNYENKNYSVNLTIIK